MFSHISHNGTQKINNNFWPRNKKKLWKLRSFFSCNSFLTELEKANYTVMAKLLKNLEKKPKFLFVYLLISMKIKNFLTTNLVSTLKKNYEENLFLELKTNKKPKWFIIKFGGIRGNNCPFSRFLSIFPTILLPKWLFKTLPSALTMILISKSAVWPQL